MINMCDQSKGTCVHLTSARILDKAQLLGHDVARKFTTHCDVSDVRLKTTGTGTLYYTDVGE